MRKKIVSFVMLFVICCSMSANCLAAENSNSNGYQKFKLIAEQFMRQYVPDAELLTEPLELYSPDNKITALYFTVKPQGYVIIKMNDGSIPEFSPKSNNTYYTDYREKYYYNGPLAYMRKNGNNFFDLQTGENLGTSAELSNTYYYKNTRKKSANYTMASSYTKKIRGVVPNYSYNPTGTCGSTAAAMLLRYYDYYVDSRYVPSYLQSSDGVLLIKHLIPLIDGSIPGSYPADIYGGLDKYLSEQGLQSNFWVDNASIGTIAGTVGDNKPYILFLQNHPRYGNHYVTGYGYSENSISDYAIVNDGHGSTEIYIDLAYTTQVIR